MNTLLLAGFLLAYSGAMRAESYLQKYHVDSVLGGLPKKHIAHANVAGLRCGMSFEDFSTRLDTFYPTCVAIGVHKHESQPASIGMVAAIYDTGMRKAADKCVNFVCDTIASLGAPSVVAWQDVAIDYSEKDSQRADLEKHLKQQGADVNALKLHLDLHDLRRDLADKIYEMKCSESVQLCFRSKMPQLEAASSLLFSEEQAMPLQLFWKLEAGKTLQMTISADFTTLLMRDSSLPAEDESYKVLYQKQAGKGFVARVVP